MNTSDQPTGPDEGPALADHNRRALARHLARPDDPKGQLIADMLDLFNRHEQETAAARAAAGDPNPYDVQPLDGVHDLATEYAARLEADDLDPYLNELADELTLDDVRALRLAGEAAVAVTPRAVLAARARDMKPDRIAAEVGLTVSRVYQIIRAQQRAAESPPVGEYRISTRDDQ